MIKDETTIDKVTVDVWNDETVIFVCDYALHPSNCTVAIALKIAKALNENTITVTTHQKEGLPKKESIEV